jgi:hypothetical protein
VRRITTMFAAMLLAQAALAGPAVAMQPPGHGAQDRFGCLDGVDQPVAGHPGGAGPAPPRPPGGPPRGPPPAPPPGPPPTPPPPPPPRE